MSIENKQVISLKQAAEHFLNQKTFAVIGLSRGDDNTAKLIYDKLNSTGHTVYALHPSESEVKGIPCHPSLADTPSPVDAAVVVTQPKHNADIIKAALANGLQWLWLHKSIGNSVEPEAVRVGREQGLNIIDGACPMMFLDPVDGGHKCMKVLMSWTGRIPKNIPVRSED